MPNTESTDTKIAVITGGSSGIGRHTAIRVAQRGAGVILTYNSSPDGAEETVATIEKHGGAAAALASTWSPPSTCRSPGTTRMHPRMSRPWGSA